MSRKKYKPREKKAHKMTKDGLTARNAVTGEVENISSRERDLLLRKQPDGQVKNALNIKKQARQNARRKKHKSKLYRTSEQTASAQATNMADVLPPSVVKNETINPNTDSVAKAEKVIDIKQQEVEKPTKSSYEATTPLNLGTAERISHLRFSDDVKSESPPAQQTEQTANPDIFNKLQFSKDSKLTPTKTGAKPRQNGKKPSHDKKYQRQFTPEAAKPQTQTVPEEMKPNNTDVQNNTQPDSELFSNDMSAEKPYALDAPRISPPSETGSKLRYNKGRKFILSPAKLKQRREVQPQNQIRGAETSQIIKKPEAVKPYAAASEQSQSKDPITPTDSRPTKLREKSGKLKFTAAKPKDKKRKKYKRHIEPKSKTAEKKFVQKTDEPTKKPDKPNKLQFTKEEKTPTVTSSDDKKLTHLQNKADKSRAKLEKARDKLPSKKRLKEVRTFDEKKGSAKNKLQFEKEVLPPNTRKPVPMSVEAAKTGTGEIKRVVTGKLRQKIYEVEDENVGTKAAHRVEQAAESVYRGGKRITRSAFRYVRNRPYRAVKKLEKKAVKADMRLSYRKALNQNPQLKSNVFSRYMQKRKIKRQYAKAAREAKRTGEAVKKTGDITVRATKAVVSAIKSHPVAAAVVLLILLIIFFIASLFSAFGGMVGSGVPAFIASTYLAQDGEINQAELAYTEWETELQMQIQNAESDYPGYNEYRYNIDGISHNPYELLAFLTAVYGEFQYVDIETLLRQIFNEQYQLAFTPSVEIRYYEDEDGEFIPYNWNVLTVTLTSRSFTEVIVPYLTGDQTGLYGLLTMSGGNRQYVGSPFDFNWLSNVTSHFGYRVHPITGAKDFHKGVDIAVPVGTEIQSAQNGKVTFAGWNDSYGYYVVIEDGNGIVTKYAHCDSLLVSAGQEVNAGDVIAKSGNTGDSTGAHLHYELVMDGQYLNALIFAMHG